MKENKEDEGRFSEFGDSILAEGGISWAGGNWSGKGILGLALFSGKLGLI